ncbi:MAG: C10 family peptidase [Bacteroidales bacterium]|nr:C10 family peptidase [Bacteroidales bacterium]
MTQTKQTFRMLSAFLTGVCVFLFMSFSFGQHVNLQRAQNVAKNLYNQQFSSELKSFDDVQVINEKIVYRHEIPTLYIFNMDAGGFVITSTDERIKPVLGYAPEGVFDTEDMSCCVSWLLDQYSNQIYDVINENRNATSYIAHEDWNRYESASQRSVEETSIVTPLLTTTWSQGCYYNAMCPADSTLGTTRCGRVPTGCVATAFAQVLKYHNFPPQGIGTKSYTHPTYGTISANFAATTYDWASMPNKLLSNNQAAATLLYHAGVSINMSYGPNGSSAYTTDVRKALVNTFKYASTTQYVYKSSYTDAQWISMIKAELDAQRVVIISGSDPNANAGHAFVCDGYQNTDHFHINWGWNGSSDGYFYLNALNPSSYAFNTSVGAIKGIKPSTTPTACSGTQTLTAASGSISDGSGTANYTDNLNCKWLIKPTNAGTVTLTFTAFDTESNYDFVKVYDGETTSATLLGSFSGSSIPASITSTTGKILVNFTSDGSQNKAGWAANYVGNPITSYCNGTTILTQPSATFNDGSGSNDYKNNTDCSWLISPPDSAVIKLTFQSFNTQASYDFVKVYDGATTSAPLLGSYSGTTLPPQLTATSGKMLVKFTSNGTTTKSGWSAKYTTQTAFCSGITTLTANSGTITDGSGNLNYNNNANCQWIIKPTNASAVTLTFTSFSTEANYDFVKVYNGTTTSSPLLGSYSGNSLPAQITASSGKMLVQFTSDYSATAAGFSANFTKVSKDFTDIEEADVNDNIVIFPNPNTGNFVLSLMASNEESSFYIVDILGKIVYHGSIESGVEQLDLNLNLSEGIYCLVIESPTARISRKIVVTGSNQ